MTESELNPLMHRSLTLLQETLNVAKQNSAAMSYNHREYLKTLEDRFVKLHKDYWGFKP